MLISEMPSVACLDFRPLERNTLKGFAKIKIGPWCLVLDGIAIHEKNGRRWAQLPDRPQLPQDGQVLRDDTGKINYAKVMEFTDRGVADRFSAAVVEAVERKR